MRALTKIIAAGPASCKVGYIYFPDRHQAPVPRTVLFSRTTNAKGLSPDGQWDKTHGKMTLEHRNGYFFGIS